MFGLDKFTFPAACYTQSRALGLAEQVAHWATYPGIKEGNVKPLWEGKRIQTQYGNNALWTLNRVFLPGNDAWDLGSDMNTERCNTQGCELQLGTKMLLQDWGEVRSKQQMHRVQECSTTYRNTDTQRSKVSVSVSDCHPQMEQVIISSAEHRVTAHVHNSHLSKRLGSPHHRRVNNYFSCTMVFEIQLWKALPVNWHFGYYFFQKGYQPGNLYLRVKINEGNK